MTINAAKIPEIIKVYGRTLLILRDEEAGFWGKIFNQNSSESNNKTSDNG
ncbi:hypothetical protein [Corynebacterium kutscheri]|nr:hypothetical protein [Corynebacterium kutscheri]